MRRHNDSFGFGLSFFLASAGSLAILLPVAWKMEVVRKWYSYYLAVTVVSTMQEHVDYAITRGVFRFTATITAGTLGMHNLNTKAEKSNQKYKFDFECGRAAGNQLNGTAMTLG